MFWRNDLGDFASFSAMRRLVAETEVRPRHDHRDVHPAALLVREDVIEPVPIRSMPGVVQHSRESLRKAAAEAVLAGVGGLMLFGIPARRDAVLGEHRPGRHHPQRCPTTCGPISATPRC